MIRAAAVTALAFTSSAQGKDASTNNLLFAETFDDVKEGGTFTSGRWVKSSVGKYQSQPIMVKPALSAAEGFESDKGLELTQEMKYYGVSSMLSAPFEPKGQDVVIQYETKFETFTCGGAYLKILRHTPELDLTQLDDKTPFSIMFGPDRCGSNNKVHFILQHQNPITKVIYFMTSVITFHIKVVINSITAKVWEEKHFNNTPMVKADKLSHLYTLHIKGADNSFDILIDKVVAASGNLMTHMEPAVNPPAEIDDPADVKPETWVDSPTIPDMSATKPDDWDESLPAMIVDTAATIPVGWAEDLESEIPDPSAEKPEDWYVYI
jgi:calnexin